MTAQRWRLQAWGHDKLLIYDGTVDSAELDEVTKRLEKRRDFVRTQIKPENLGNRQTFELPIGGPARLPDVVVTVCRECERREPACRAISEAVSGHVFTPIGGSS